MKLSQIIKAKLKEGYNATRADWMPHEYITLDEDGNVIDDRGKKFSDAKFRQVDKKDSEIDWAFFN